MCDISNNMLSASELFIARARRALTSEYLPRVRACVEKLGDEQLWWRPNEASNSIANLLLHLGGNLRQYVVSGVGGAPDERRREEEFGERGSLSASELIERLAATVAEADRTLEQLDPEILTERRTIQGREVTLLDAIGHAVEHFAMHTGQITYVTKLLTESDLGFYEIVDGIPRARWEGRARDLGAV